MSEERSERDELIDEAASTVAAPAVSPLERRYRRWMGLFPVAYRSKREDELVGVLLDAAAPGQGRPHVAEVVDLARAAASAHIRAIPASPRRRSWSDAATVIAIVLVAVLAAQGARYGALVDYRVRQVGASGAPALQPGEVLGWYVPLAWAAVLALVAMGATRLAAIGAWIAVAGRVGSILEIAGMGRPGSGMAANTLWIAQPLVVQLTLGIIAAVLLSRPRRVRSVIIAVGRGRLAAALGLFLVTAGGWRWYSWSASGANVWLLVSPLVLVLVAWAGDLRLRDLPSAPLARRVAVGLVALLAIYVVSDGLVDPRGLHIVTRRDLAATLFVGLVVAAASVVLIAITPVVARRMPFQIVRRRT